MKPPTQTQDETPAEARPVQLRLHDTMTGGKPKLFSSIDPQTVRLYVCGPTVYDSAHIGNARPVIVFDLLFRLLKQIYPHKEIRYVRNITDVDDKINARAARDFPNLPLNEAIAKVTEATERQFHEDVAALGCLPPTHEPRATQYIDTMRAMIERLVARGVAYVAEDHVLFSPNAMDALAIAPRYGTLAHRSIDEMLAGARVEVAPYKRDPMDFVLWKPSKPNEPGWPSPAGIAAPGRPGWHIECSAMSMATLLEPFGGGLECEDPIRNVFDIHGGGIDLVFPHHENEIAQSCSAFHSRAMANFWMHNGFLQVEGEKMAKSAGNFVTIRELLLKYPGDALRLNMLRTHYRQPIDWTESGLRSAMEELRRWAELVVDRFGFNPDLEAIAGHVDTDFLHVLANDLNTPLALGRLHQLYQFARSNDHYLPTFVATAIFMGFSRLSKPGYYYDGFSANLIQSGPQLQTQDIREILAYRAATANTASSHTSSIGGYSMIASQYKQSAESKGFVIALNDAGVLLVGNKPGTQSKAETDFRKNFEADIDKLVLERSAARARGDWQEADRLRQELDRMGVAPKDGKDDGPLWQYKSAGSPTR
jgi:cysteinyl-tRNA synthetase